LSYLWQLVAEATQPSDFPHFSSESSPATRCREARAARFCQLTRESKGRANALPPAFTFRYPTTW